jgi:EcsC protein family
MCCPETSLSEADLAALAVAVRQLERPGLAGRLTALAGRPVELIGRRLPTGASAVVARATGLALDRALKVALYSLHGQRPRGGRRLHSALASASGAVGGAFGLAALAVELPVSTTIMLRAIAAIARDEGEDLGDPLTGLACLEVFALGGPSDEGEAETGYFAVRGLLAEALVGAGNLLGRGGVLGQGAPYLVRFMVQVAARFGIVVSQKVAAQAVAIVGAVGGAAVNLAFTEHFQEVARGHFAVRRLERAYGAAPVRAEYERLKAALTETAARPAEPENCAIADGDKDSAIAAASPRR